MMNILKLIDDLILSQYMLLLKRLTHVTTTSFSDFFAFGDRNKNRCNISENFTLR